MREKLKYFIINKAYDYNRGFYENMVVRGNSLCFSSDSNSGVGRFLTRVFDAGKRGMNWHRLVIDTENCEPEALRITVYACDSGAVRYRGNSIPIEEFMELEGISLDDRLTALAPYTVRKVSGVTDVLLHYVSGRFFWAYIEVYSPGGGRAALIDNVKIYLDESLKLHETVYPAAGTDHSAVRLTIPELEHACPTAEWIDVCKTE